MTSETTRRGSGEASSSTMSTGPGASALDLVEHRGDDLSMRGRSVSMFFGVKKLGR